VVDGRQEQSSTRLKNQLAPAARNETCHALKYSSMWEATRSREGVAVVTDSRQVGTVLLALIALLALISTSSLYSTIG
jgi:hypothetical protein